MSTASRRYSTELGEFDAYYDWMHHGESGTLLYLIGMADPDSLSARTRARRFAGLYDGRDPEAANYDSVHRLIRSPLTGSCGPRFVVTEEDWSTHREVLNGYPPPFENIPGAPGPLCRWTDDAVFTDVLERMNAQMTRGDVPLNLTATSMATHAFMLDGDEHHRHWVLDYHSAWVERARRNGGILPDNVGLTGVIGEYTGGRWWGGYYGWRWPHGAATILEPAAVGSCNAALLAGDPTRLDLIRSQLDLLAALGREVDGVFRVPNRHTDAGWTDERPVDVRVPLVVWFAGLGGHAASTDADATRVRRISGSTGWGIPEPVRVKGNGAGNSQHWFAFLHGANADYPEQILAVDRHRMDSRLTDMADDTADPQTWDVHLWQDLSPVFTEGLVQTMWGAPLHVYHGGLSLASLRYLDLRARRPGLPPDVAALVDAIGPTGVRVTLVNCSAADARELIVQAGAFAEHDIVGVRVDGAGTVDVVGPWLGVRLGPSSTVVLDLELRRYANSPTYAQPWTDTARRLPLIRPRFAHPTP